MELNYLHGRRLFLKPFELADAPGFACHYQPSRAGRQTLFAFWVFRMGFSDTNSGGRDQTKWAEEKHGLKPGGLAERRRRVDWICLLQTGIGIRIVRKSYWLFPAASKPGLWQRNLESDPDHFYSNHPGA